MIREEDLYNLGYRIKNRLTDSSKSIDFVHNEKNQRLYIVNLEEGEVTIHYPNTMPHYDFFRTSNLDEFKNWHDLYKN